MKKLFKSYTFNILLILVFTFGVLWFTLKDNFSEVMGILSHVKVEWLFVIIFACVFYQVIIGWILRELTRISNPHYTLWQGFQNAFVAAFFHGVTPSASGGQFAQVYVFKKHGVAISDSASVLWMDFILYQMTMVISVFILILLRFVHFYTNYSQFFILVLFGFVINGMVIVGLWAIARFPKIYTWLTTKGIELCAKLHIVKNKEKTLSSINAQLERFNGETVKLKQHKTVLFRVILANLVRLALYYSIPFFCFKALGVPIDSGMILDIMALSSFVAMINAFIPIPGASGGTEATFVLMFSTIVSRLSAASSMILWRFATYYMIMILGGLMFIFVRSQPALIVDKQSPEEAVLKEGE